LYSGINEGDSGCGGIFLLVLSAIFKPPEARPTIGCYIFSNCTDKKNRACLEVASKEKDGKPS
jgi:hypothetical protein